MHTGLSEAHAFAGRACRSSGLDIGWPSTPRSRGDIRRPSETGYGGAFLSASVLTVQRVKIDATERRWRRAFNYDGFQVRRLVSAQSYRLLGGGGFAHPFRCFAIGVRYRFYRLRMDALFITQAAVAARLRRYAPHRWRPTQPGMFRNAPKYPRIRAS